jgi:hypothetical protein
MSISNDDADEIIARLRVLVRRGAHTGDGFTVTLRDAVGVVAEQCEYPGEIPEKLGQRDRKTEMPRPRRG